MRLVIFGIVGLTAFVSLCVVALGIFVILVPSLSMKVEANALSSKEAIITRNNTGLILLDRNGTEFYRFYQARKLDPLPLKDIPLSVQEAVIAAEDKHFYSHGGVSFQAIGASLVANLRHNDTSYGGSTITQQLAKTSFLTPEKSWQRKVQELLLARQLEKRYSKNDILEMYLNSVYLGEGAFGVQDASKTYFSKPISEITIAQAALLAGILTAPSAYSPVSGDKAAAISRQHTVLQQMEEQGYITFRQHQAALTADLGIQPSQELSSSAAPHFSLMVRQALITEYGEQTVAHSGYTITTTLDLNWQRTAEQAVTAQVQKLAKNRVTNGSVVVIEPKTGHIRAVVGSRDWNQDQYGKFNVATALRQPGSSFKPIVYLAALEKELITPVSTFKDVPTDFGGGYRPQNYDRHFRGTVTVRRALSTSLNIPTVLVAKKVGIPAVLDLANRLGVTSLDNFSPNDLSLSLGSGETRLTEMTNAYATFARGGNYLPAALITQINSKSGERIFTYTPSPERVIDERYTYLLTSILSDNAARREVFGNALTLSRPAAVKTGTSQDYKDSWTIGYTPSLVIGVWVGNNDGTLMDNVAGSLGAAPIWKHLMETFSKDTQIEKFNQPADVTKISLCRANGLRAPDKARGAEFFQEYFAQGTEPTKKCSGTPPSPSPSPSATPSQSEPIPYPVINGSGT